jgi:hypothetical protein
MTRLPEPKWLDLSVAYARSVAAFPEEEPIDVDLALVAAFADGTMGSRGRCESYSGHDGLHGIAAHVWTSAGFVPQWPVNRLGIPRDTGWHIFTDVKVNRIELEKWLADSPVRADSRMETSRVISDDWTRDPFDYDRAEALVVAEKLRGIFRTGAPTEPTAEEFLLKTFDRIPRAPLRKILRKYWPVVSTGPRPKPKMAE